jgi:two-component system, OmpR family, sensor histidine kinase BaeS
VFLRATWLPRFALVSGVVALLGLAAINPDAWIARQNLDRYAESGRIDWTFLQSLSDDAVPTFVDLPPAERYCALLGHANTHDDWLEWNLGRSRADHALESTSRGTHDTSVSCRDSRD